MDVENGRSERSSVRVTEPFLSKLRRLDSGEPLRVLDLFAGCGGFSLGFCSAGFTISGAIEADPTAARTHAANFHAGSHSRALDIRATVPSEYATSVSGGVHHKYAFDIIVGGPPCQTFARIGRAKLRAESSRAAEWDSRAQLYAQYLRYVKELLPLVIVFENVPDILNYSDQNVAASICQQLEEAGYVVGCTLLNAAFFGVPQLRERLYLLAYHRSLRCSVDWPEPTHFYHLPQGYADIRTFARKRMSQVERFPEITLSRQDLEPAVTAEQALHDLPRIFARQALASGHLERIDQRMNIPVPYRSAAAAGTYPSLMRNWPGFQSGNTVEGHVIRRLPRDYRIFEQMEPGDQYPQAFRIARQLFTREVDRLRQQGMEIEEGSIEWVNLVKAFVPPYCPNKFPNKWRKIEPDAPSRTLMAHLSHDSYSHIHYDSEQARTISVREAARLQSFPDAFQFCGAMNESYKQIGNAVPPLVSYALAQKIARQLGLTVPTTVLNQSLCALA